MRISILCSSQSHPVYDTLILWRLKHQQHHDVEIVHSKMALSGGDILFLISCNEIIDTRIRRLYKNTLVVHASDLPKGKGWSPHIWQILEGKNKIVVSLLEAEDNVDSGAIWSQRSLFLDGNELYEEINAKLFSIESELMDFAVANYGTIVPVPQKIENATFYRKRTPEDSRINPKLSIEEQFDLLRVADNERFPAYFEYRGCRYEIRLKKNDI